MTTQHIFQDETGHCSQLGVAPIAGEGLVTMARRLVNTGTTEGIVVIHPAHGAPYQVASLFGLASNSAANSPT
jgi:hypothetical protein